MNSKVTRRQLVLGSLAILSLPLGVRAQSEQPDPVDLGNGLEVRDYRLLPDANRMLFIAEVHNLTDEAMDSPTVGVRLPNLESEMNFGWASSVEPVIYPHTSTGVVGVAPVGMKSDSEWSDPEWVLCETPNNVFASSVAQFDMIPESRIYIRDPKAAEVFVSITNKGIPNLENLWFCAQIWDADGRWSGSTFARPFATIAEGETYDTRFWIAENVAYFPRPLTLMETVDDVSVSISIQPNPVANPKGCPVLMPWNN